MLDIKDQMALDVGVPYRDPGSFWQDLEGLGAVLYFLPYRPPRKWFPSWRPRLELPGHSLGSQFRTSDEF